MDNSTKYRANLKRRNWVRKQRKLLKQPGTIILNTKHCCCYCYSILYLICLYRLLILYYRKHVQKFCKTLQTKVKDQNLELYLWVSCTGTACTTQGHTLPFTNILNCPPAVVREVKPENLETKKTNICYLPPTDGPPIKFIYYASSLISKPHDCLEYGKEVGSFLAETLLITASG